VLNFVTLQPSLLLGFIDKIGMMFIQANAKINLSFAILGKLPNGYHRIESITQSIDLADFLFFEKAKKTQLTGSYICADTDNLISKAQKVLEEESGRKLPCHIYLQKVIPISAGLGGGSADAAATLIAINEIYKLNFPKNKLAEIGVKVGADVPFFIFGGTCKVGGVGEEVVPIKRKSPKFYVIARPHKRLETKMMYGLNDKTGKNFLKLAGEICPSVKKVYNFFKKFRPKELGLSGSGPSLFCGVKSYELAKKIIKGLNDLDGDVFLCRPQKEGIKILSPVTHKSSH